MSSPESESLVLGPACGPPPMPADGLPRVPALVRGLRTALRSLWPYLLFTLLFVLYWLAGDLYLLTRGNVGIFRIEYPLALYVFFAANRILRPSRWRVPLALLAVFGPYGVHDIYWFIFNDAPELTALREVPELYTVLGWPVKALLLGLAAASVYVFVTQVRFAWGSLLVSLPGLIVVAVLLLAPAKVTAAIKWGSIWVNPYVKADNAALIGRFTSTLHNEAKRRIAMGRMGSYADAPAQRVYYDRLVEYLKGHVVGDRPVFIVVLESFLDARTLKPVRGRDEILAPEFLRRYGKALGYSISPTFGGGTARAEFELLCGVPSLREFDSVEFNLFAGRRVPCMPEVLARVGYDTIASYPYIPSFFNAQRAYPGLGFREVYFAQELSRSPSYLHVESKDKYLFDGELYRQNRAFLEGREGGQRFFSYLLTLYGHLPFEVQHPIRWKVDAKGTSLERIVNQTYYRTGPLAEQIQWIVKRYPRALVIAVADHLPVLRAEPEIYTRMGYLGKKTDAYYFNRILVIKDGKPTKLPTLYHFSIPDLVYDYLTDGAYCKDNPCATGYPYDKELLRARYRYLMGNAVLAPERSRAADAPITAAAR
jgi:hypothetical protein